MAEEMKQDDVTRKERYEALYNEVSVLKQKLSKASTEKEVSESLDYLAKFFMKVTVNDQQWSSIIELVEEIVGTISAVQLHDATRNVLNDLLQKLLLRVETIIAEEREKENTGKLKKLLYKMAEHAPEIAKIVDINKIFG